MKALIPSAWIARHSIFAGTLLVAACAMPGSSSSDSELANGPASAASSADQMVPEEFRRTLHACQHMRRPLEGEPWHASATSPEIENCLKARGWQTDGTLLQTESFRRASYACQHVRSHRRRQAGPVSAQSPQVRRCLASKGWQPDGTPIVEAKRE